MEGSLPSREVCTVATKGSTKASNIAAKQAHRDRDRQQTVGEEVRAFLGGCFGGPKRRVENFGSFGGRPKVHQPRSYETASRASLRRKVLEV